MRYFLRIFPLCVEYWVIVKAVLRGIVCIGNGRTAASESAEHASLCGATLLGSKSTLFLFLWQTLRQVPSSIISRHAKAVIVPWKQLSILLADVYLRGFCSWMAPQKCIAKDNCHFLKYNHSQKLGTGNWHTHVWPFIKKTLWIFYSLLLLPPITTFGGAGSASRGRPGQ